MSISPRPLDETVNVLDPNHAQMHSDLAHYVNVAVTTVDGLSSSTPAATAVTGTSGVATTASRSDHVHASPQLTGTAAVALATTGAAGVATDAARSDHVHPTTALLTTGNLSSATPTAIATVGAAGSSGNVSRADHTHAGILLGTAGALALGTASAGASTTLSAAIDHVHPSQVFDIPFSVFAAASHTNAVVKIDPAASLAGLISWGSAGTFDASIGRIQTAMVGSLDSDIVAGVVGKGFRVKEGTNAKMGVVTLVTGAATVANTSVTSTSRIFLCSQTDGGTPGTQRVSLRTAGTGFVITSSTTGDTSTVAWIMYQPAP